jgi:hypothetical protein
MAKLDENKNKVPLTEEELKEYSKKKKRIKEERK